MHATDFTETQILPENGINECFSKVSVEDISFLNLMEEICFRLPFTNINFKI